MQNMRTGQIILPVLRNDGTTSLAETHKRLANLLIAAFGGCTVVFGSGMYNNPERGVQVEEVYIYTVVYDPSANHDLVLRAIAREIGGEAGQDAVYVQYASGNVALVPPFVPKDQAVNQPPKVNGVIPERIPEHEEWRYDHLTH